MCSYYNYIIRSFYNAILLLDVREQSLNDNFFFSCLSLEVFYYQDLIIKMNNHNSAFVASEYKSFKVYYCKKILIFKVLNIDMIHHCSITYHMTDILIIIVSRNY